MTSLVLISKILCTFSANQNRDRVQCIIIVYNSVCDIFTAANAFSTVNPVLDAWNGARKWARSLNSLQAVSVTREDYDEKGGEYLKEHFASNRYVPTPPQS